MKQSSSNSIQTGDLHVRHIEIGMNKNRQRVTSSIKRLIHSEFADVNWNSPENLPPPPRVMDWTMTGHLPGNKQRPVRWKDHRRREVTPEEYANLISRQKAFNFELYEKKSNHEKDLELQEHYRRYREKLGIKELQGFGFSQKE